MLGQAQKLAPKPFLNHFSGSEKCFRKGFGASSSSSSGPSPELVQKPVLKHFSVSDKCFKNGFVASSGLGPDMAQKCPRNLS